MTKVDIKIFLKLPHFFKIIEMVATFLVMLLYRIPDCRYGNVNMNTRYFLGWDAISFADMVYFGAFFLCIIQIISILGGDKSPTLDILFAFFGFLFFLSIGAKIIDVWRLDVMRVYDCYGTARALGALSIITSFVYICDAAFNAFELYKK